MTFDGFSQDLPVFLGEVAETNSKDWFEEHRDDYRRLFVDPALSFIEAFSGAAQSFDPPLEAVPKINGSLRRINRDTRFSKDKRLYHDHMHLIFWTGDHPNRSPGIHVVIHTDGLGMGAGHWGFDAGQLARYRSALGDPKAAGDLAKAIEAARAGGGGELDPPHLARLPKGFSADPAHEDLLRYKGIVLRNTVPFPDALFGPGAVDYVAKRAEAYMPLHRWLVNRVYG